MTPWVAGLNLLLGSVYTCYGIMTIIEMRRGWKQMGFSHFGAAWIAMAFTCGPHHLAHGLHLALSPEHAGVLDLAYVLIGLPAGAIWFLLRVEAFRGGRGDRFITGTPWWLAIAPILTIVYAAVFVVLATLTVRHSGVRFIGMVIPNFLLVVVYTVIGWVLLRTQMRNRKELGGWSLSGSALTVVFPTCAVMHATWATYALAGVYSFQIHGFVIDWLAVPAAIYLLWVVHGLYKDALRDWNRRVERVPLLVG
ncbi:MAG: hypothetical protein ACYDCC_04220 [Actinomycetota bacterium]